MSTLPRIKTFAVIGRRTNGEVLYLCTSATQGQRFVPNAYSQAEVFTDRDYAEIAVERLQPHWKGLKLEIESRLDGETANHNAAMLAAFGAHGQG